MGKGAVDSFCMQVTNFISWQLAREPKAVLHLLVESVQGLS